MISALQMPRQFQGLKLPLSNREHAKAKFADWLFVQAAGVLFEKKAGELLTMPTDFFGVNHDTRLAYLADLAHEWGFSYRKMHQNAFSSKIMIYKREIVRQRLAATPLCILWGVLNYPLSIEPESFLAEVQHRWEKNNRIPHEIGLALGYPIKDVLGYMGLLPLPYSGDCGWRIYGDPASSKKISAACLWAKEQAICLLAQKKI